MKDDNDNLWTISELAAEAASVLSVEEIDQASGRVSDIPSTRTIRYYTTHGLLDRPSAFRGRTALYDRRHLLQLVAIKRLQARGVGLTGVQNELVGATDEELEALAAIAASEDDEQPVTPTPRRAQRTGDFWAEPVAEVESGSDVTLLQSDSVEKLSAVRLADGLVVLLDNANRELWDDDLEAIRVAAEPLVKLLKSRRLIGDA